VTSSPGGLGKGRAGRWFAGVALGVAGLAVPAAAYAAVAGPSYAHGATGASRTVRSVAAGSPGACKDADGVTVVVDYTDLGGPVVERCAGWPVSSGFDALAKAGFSVAQPTRTPGFVCRLQGRPSPTETLDTTSDPTYHEQCVNTPPTDAYWSYWSARNGGRWTYDTVGASAHQAIRGGFEGWSFALNRTTGTVPAPRATPRHAVPPPPPPPPTSGPPTSAPPSSAPPSSAPPSSAGPSSAGPTSAPPAPPRRATPSTGPAPARSGRPATSTPSPSTMAQAAHTPRHPRPHRSRRTGASPAAADPTTDVPSPRTGTGALPAQPKHGGGSPVATVAGLCVVGLLTALGGVTAWRRRAGGR
jgi:hypothetical protein